MSLAAAFSFQTQFLALMRWTPFAKKLHFEHGLEHLYNNCRTADFLLEMGVMHCSGGARERCETQEVPCQSKMDRKSNFYQRDGENGAGQKWATKKLIIVRLTEHN